MEKQIIMGMKIPGLLTGFLEKHYTLYFFPYYLLRRKTCMSLIRLFVVLYFFRLFKFFLVKIAIKIKISIRHEIMVAIMAFTIKTLTYARSRSSDKSKITVKSFCKNFFCSVIHVILIFLYLEV